MSKKSGLSRFAICAVVLSIVSWFTPTEGKTHDFPATPPGKVIGDPHFTTFDGLEYGFQGIGDFVLVRSVFDDDLFQVQIRTSAARKHPGASVVSEAAVALCSRLITFDINRTDPDEDLVWINGLASSVRIDSPRRLDDCEISKISSTVYKVEWGTGEMLRLVTDLDRHLFNMFLWYSPLLGPDSVEGLLTTSDNPEGWRIRNAPSLFDIPEPASFRQLIAGLAILVIYGSLLTGTVALRRYLNDAGVG